MFDYISISTKNADTKSQIEKFCINNNIDIESTVSDQGEILNSRNRIAYPLEWRDNELYIQLPQNLWQKCLS